MQPTLLQQKSMIMPQVGSRWGVYNYKDQEKMQFLFTILILSSTCSHKD